MLQCVFQMVIWIGLLCIPVNPCTIKSAKGTQLHDEEELRRTYQEYW